MKWGTDMVQKIIKYIRHPSNVLVFLQHRCNIPLLSDEAYLKICYRQVMGKELDLAHPKTFNEKLQWLKIHDRKPVYTRMVDKYEAKQYVAEKIGEEYVIPTLGVWDRFEDIAFDRLPDQFALKCTHDSGGLVIVRNKAELDRARAKKIIEASLKKNYYYSGREWPYKDVKPRILAEAFMGNTMRDYKFYCFHGEPRLLYISEGLEDHKTARISFLTLDWQFAEFKRTDYRAFEQLPEKPENFEKMLELARTLSAGMRFLRVDLYSIENRIYFSELTFTPCSGLMPFEPEEWDAYMGEWLTLAEE